MPRTSKFRYGPEVPSVKLLWRDRCHDLERQLRIAKDENAALQAEVERLKGEYDLACGLLNTSLENERRLIEEAKRASPPACEGERVDVEAVAAEIAAEADFVGGWWRGLIVEKIVAILRRRFPKPAMPDAQPVGGHCCAERVVEIRVLKSRLTSAIQRAEQAERERDEAERARDNAVAEWASGKTFSEAFLQGERRATDEVPVPVEASQSHGRVV